MPSIPHFRTAALAASLALAGPALFAPAPLLAHKPVTARFTYEEHIRPLFEERCGACHHPGGPAPMSLLTYKEARPWAEAIKEEILEGTMPPWPIHDTSLELRGDRRLSAAEIDRIADWATGGAPEGKRASSGANDPADAGASVPTSAARGAGGQTPASTLTISLSITRDDRERIETTTLPLNRSTLWLEAVAFVPGNRAVVHDARIDVIDAGASADSSTATLLTTWTPAAPVLRYPEGSAREIPAGAALRVTVRYRRPWNMKEERVDVTCRIELFGRETPPPRRVRVVTAPHTLAPGEALLALTPIVESPASFELTIDGTTALRTLDLQPSWPLRFELERPLDGRAAIGLERFRRDGAVWLEILTTPDAKPSRTR